MGVYLTDRDYKVLDLLIKQGFAYLEQIQALGFPSKKSAVNRISLLAKEGYITSEKMKVTPSLKKWFNNVWAKDKSQVTYGLHNKTIYKPGKNELSQVRLTTDRTDQMIKHQLGLNRTLEQLSCYFMDPVILSEEDLEQEDQIVHSGHSKVSPDLVFYEKNIRLALEYERNVKAKKIYFEKWYRYQRARSYTHVLYICETQIVFDSLVQVARNFPQIGFIHITNFNQVMTGMGWMSTRTFLGLK